MSKYALLPLALATALLLSACESEPEAPPPETVAEPAQVEEPSRALVAAKPIEEQPLYHTEELAEGPDAASEQMPSLIKGGDFENVSSLQPPWYTRLHAKRDTYRFDIDTTLFHSGKASLRIEQVKPEVWGALMQRVKVDVTMGRELELTAMLYGDGLIEAPGVHFVTKARNQRPTVGEIRIAPEQIAGQWGKARLRIALPEGTEVVEVGVSHYGPGRLWVDDIAVRAVNPL